MKKIYLFAFACLFFLAMQFNTFAQASLDKGNVLLNVGLGVGVYYYGGGVPFVASAEFAVNNFVSVGPYFGIGTFRERYFSDRYNYTYFEVGARGSYHFSEHLNLNTDKLDLYGGVLLGYRSNNADEFFSYNTGVRFGVFGGARWYFSDRFAVNGEVGYGVAAMLIGVSFKLGN